MSREIKKKSRYGLVQTGHESTEKTPTSQQVWLWRMLSVTLNAPGQEGEPGAANVRPLGGFAAHLIPTVDASADQEGAS